MSNAIQKLPHCAINTKPIANQNCHALRICLNCLLCDFVARDKLGNENIILNTKNYKRVDSFLWFKNQRTQHFLERPPQARDAALKRSISFYLRETQRTDISANTDFRWTCPFHTLRPNSFPVPNTIFTEAISRTLACFMVSVTQEFEPTMLICRHRKNEWPKTTKVKKPKNFALSHNALLRGEQRNTEAAAYHLNHLNQRIVKMPRVANPSWTVCYVRGWNLLYTWLW